MIMTNVVINKFKRGKGLWKFNNLLSDIEYLNMINREIINIKKNMSF